MFTYCRKLLISSVKLIPAYPHTWFVMSQIILLMIIMRNCSSIINVELRVHTTKYDELTRCQISVPPGLFTRFFLEINFLHTQTMQSPRSSSNGIENYHRAVATKILSLYF